ncbi:hypothetical protein FH972_002796 [Carpinus fangiana]|uniref:Uncharacterized protein n=1 Tax=Carpinus fangiana TaxID=176857 RepID=A0A5N6QIC6_9ROSI|nr:hypothetical protein FH972_002796 [Carpinus fangiana]
MAESPSSTRKSNPQKVLTVMDMRVAQQLMQLSNEDNKNNRKNDTDDNEVVDKPRSDNTSTIAKIEEIFGKEDTYRPKKRRYLSLVSIYTATKPMKVRYGKKVRSSTNPNFVTDSVTEY